MTYLRYLFSLVLMISQFIYAAGFLVLFSLSKKPVYPWCAALSITLAINDLLVHMAGFLPGFSVFYVSYVTSEPLCRAALNIAYLVEYRMILDYGLSLPLHRGEPAVLAGLTCLIPLVSFLPLTPLFNFFYNSVTWAYIFYTLILGLVRCPSCPLSAPSRRLWSQLLVAVLTLQLLFYAETLFWLVTGRFPAALIHPGLEQSSIFSILLDLLFNCAALIFLIRGIPSLHPAASPPLSSAWSPQQLHAACQLLKLTQREEEVALQLMQRQKIADIAQTLCISPGTVKAHIHNILVKADVPNQERLREKLARLPQR